MSTNSKNKKGILISIVCGIMVLIVAVVFLIIQFGGKSVDRRIEHGNQSFENGNYEDAIANYSEALRKDDTNAETKEALARAYRAYGDSLAEQGNLEKSAELYEKSIEIVPDTNNIVLLAETYTAIQSYQNAEETYRRLTEIDSENVTYWHEYAHSCENNHDEESFSEAEKTLIVNLHAAEDTLYTCTVTESATCAKEGTAVYTCAICGKEKTGILPVTDEHTWDDGHTEIEPTCKDEGELVHTCTVCGKTESEKISVTDNHEWDDGVISEQPTCGEAGELTYTCTVCEQTKSEKIPVTEEHKWDVGTVTKEPACGVTGVKTYTCEACGLTKEETVPALAHKWDAGKVTKEATTEQAGEKTYTCTVCGSTRKEAVPQLEEEIVFDDPVLAEALKSELFFMGKSKWTVADAEKVTSLLLYGQLINGGGRVPDCYATINSLNDLRYFPNLTKLEMKNYQVKDISMLQNLTSLTKIKFHSVYGIEDLSALKNLNNLKELQLTSCGVSDNSLNQIWGLTNLTSLSLGANTISVSDITLLSNLTNLTYLSLGWNRTLSDITPLKNLTKLKELRLAENAIKDITPLQGLTNLEKLILCHAMQHDNDKNRVSDITPLQNLTKLSYLNLENECVTDLTPLKNLTNLKELYIRGNPITDYSPIENLPNLEVLKTDMEALNK